MNRVARAENLVGELEGLGPEAWKRLRSHARYVRFMEEYLRAKCLTDLWYHMRYAVYFRQMKHYYEPLHGSQGVAGFLSRWERERLGDLEPVGIKFLVMARGECKTQEALAWITWEYARDPNNRLLVRAYVEPKANEIMSSIRELLRTPGYVRMYPWVKPKEKPGGQWELWNDSRFMLARDDAGIRVPSAEAYGVKGAPTGSHFHLGFYDDYEVGNNAWSQVGRAELLQTWKDDSNLFEAGARRLLCGTPWSRHALIYPVISRTGEFKRHDFDVFVQPWFVQVFSVPFVGSEPTLDRDRVTIRDCTQSFPTVEANLRYCEARVRFEDPSTHDLTEEIREVTWNNGTSFIVNRPFPEMLGQPLGYVIGTKKPVDPNRLTLDSVDWIPPKEVLDVRVARSSILKKRKDQGPLVFASQMEMTPVESSQIVLDPEMLMEIREEEIPDGDRVYYRACDFATAKQTQAATVMTTGFWHRTGFYIQHIAYGERMTSMDKLLELFVGVLRVKGWGHVLKCTFLEEAMIEQTLGEFIDQAERNPYEFFASREGYVSYAEEHFSDRRPMMIRRYNLKRGGQETKTLRIAAQQPEWAARRVFIVKGCPHVEVLVDQARSFSLDSKEPNDVLDTLADLIREGRAPAVEESTRPEEGVQYWASQQEAMRRVALVESGGAIGGWRF
jgi:hypothetical protein